MFQQKYEDIVVLIRTNRTDKTGLVMFRTIRTVRTVYKYWVRPVVETSTTFNVFFFIESFPYII